MAHISKSRAQLSASREETKLRTLRARNVVILLSHLTHQPFVLHVGNNVNSEPTPVDLRVGPRARVGTQLLAWGAGLRTVAS